MQKPKKEHWTWSAVDCYKRGCCCEGCFYSQFSNKCMMAEMVLKLLAKHGEPPEKFRNYLRMEDENE